MMKSLALILSCALCGLAMGQSESPKPPFGVPKDARFFNGKWYQVVNEQVEWSRAKAKCLAAGGQLAVVPDEATWDFVKSLTTTTVWLGATDEKVEGEWVWVDGTKMTFTAWGGVQPDNNGGEENYLAIWKGLWNDAARNTRSNKENPVVGYICEWKASP